MQDTSKYRKLTHLEHVTLRKGMYIGDATCVPAAQWLVSGEGAIEKVVVPAYNSALLKIIFEVIDNAYDNTMRDPPTTHIAVRMTDTEVEVVNDGKHIPVQKQGGAWIPTVIFSEFLSGTNFDDAARDGATGVNGLGVKLTAAHSRRFTVTCADPIAKLKFTQTWTDGLKATTGPTVAPLPKAHLKRAVTSVAFTPDLAHFDGAVLRGDIERCVHARLVELSAMHRGQLKVTWQGEPVTAKTFKQYVTMHGLGDSALGADGALEWGLALSATGEFEHASFVNCLRTTSPDSTHTKLVTNAAVKALAGELARRNGGAKVPRASIIAKLHVFANIRVADAQFSSQTKTQLTTKLPGIAVDADKMLRLLKRTGVVDELDAGLKRTVMNDAVGGGSAPARPRAAVRVKNLDDAHVAGTAQGSAAMLFVVEGLSAKTLVSAGMSVIGRKKFGCFPIKGKLLNVREASPAQLKANAEVQALCTALGLHAGRKYETAAERATLRYGRVCILADQDLDGVHITGLLLNMFAFFWPALLESHYVLRFITPLIKVDAAPRARFFYSMRDYEAANVKGHVHYLKGLGSNARADAVGYFRDMEAVHLKLLDCDAGTMPAMARAFSKKEIEARKAWIVAGDDSAAVDFTAPRMNVTDFLSTEMLTYSLYSLRRAIPSVVDGLKVSQRKVLMGSFLKFGGATNAPFKVAQHAAFVAEKTMYAHGEVSLQGAVVQMAQDYPLSNNLPLLAAEGAFGSRSQNGDDAASPRYIFTRLQPYTRRLFPAADDGVLRWLEEEGVRVEPEWYAPTLPVALLNGVAGIATGFSTFIPAFRPRDVAAAVLHRVGGTAPPPPLVPWYRGYSTNALTVDNGASWTFTGAVEAAVGGKARCAVTELPPFGHSFDAYKANVLDKLLADGAIDEVVVDHPSENAPRFLLRLGAPLRDLDDAALLAALSLTKTISKKNMNLLDASGAVKAYPTAEAIVDDWLVVKLDVTARRKAHVLAGLRATRAVADLRARFIAAARTIDLFAEDATDAVAAALGCTAVEAGALLDMSIRSLTAERARRLAAERDRCDEEILTLEKKSPAGMIREDVEALMEYI